MERVDRLERDKYLLDSVRSLRRQLKTVHAGIVVCTRALRHQNVDHDADIARVLNHLVADRLREQIECLTELRAALRNPAGMGTRRRPS